MMDEIPVLLRALQTGMTVVKLVPGIFHNVIPVLDERSDGQIPESLMMRGYDG